MDRVRACNGYSGEGVCNSIAAAPPAFSRPSALSPPSRVAAQDALMSESSYRGFPISIFIRRRADEWEVTTTIHAPEALAHELGDQVIVDVVQLASNRIEQVRSNAFDQAKKTIDGIVRDRAGAVPPASR
jgi:hypothetical protein